MGKNNRLINQMKEIARRKQNENIGKAADQMVTQIYAAMAIALHRTYGFGYERINRVFYESQNIWNEYVCNGNVESMEQACFQETGIDVQKGKSGYGES